MSDATFYIATNFFPTINTLNTLNGPKKRLWDNWVNPPESLPQCSTYDPDYVETEPELGYLFETSDNQYSMYFVWENNSSLITNIVYYTSRVEVDPYPPRMFMKGQTQPIITASDGRMYALQSYYTVDQNTGEVTVDGGSTAPGIEENICSYFDYALADQWHALSASDGWKATCGVLAEDAWCGWETCEGELLVDEKSGTWCQIDGTAAFDSIEVEKFP